MEIDESAGEGLERRKGKAGELAKKKRKIKYQKGERERWREKEK